MTESMIISTLTSSQALFIIQNQFPKLKAETISLFSAGWDNFTYLINNCYVFRFPRRPDAIPLLEHELYILPKIVSLLPYAIPVPEWIGQPTDKYPWLFVGYRLLKGNTMCQITLSDDQRTSFAKPLAQFLSSLHTLEIKKEYKENIPYGTERKLDIVARVPKFKEQLEEIKALGLFKDIHPLNTLIDSASAVRQPRTTSLVHGDLYIRHLLVEERNTLTGIIDWGDVHIGDPAVDIAIAHSFLPPQAHEIFKQAYGTIDEDTWRLARLRALIHNAVLVLYGHKSGPSIAQEGLRALKYIAEQVS